MKLEFEVVMKIVMDGFWIFGFNNDEYLVIKYKGVNKVLFIIGMLCRCLVLWDCGVNYVLVVGII